MNQKSVHLRSRQKSCVACAEGKRRCNRQTPQCSRCLSRRVQCVYVERFSRQDRDEARSQASYPCLPCTSRSYSDLASRSSPVGSSLTNYLDTDPWLSIGPSLLAFPSVTATDPSYPDLVFLDRWSVDQLVRNIKKYPRMFACSQKSPFIHARLYETKLPDAIQDAFTVCAAYFTKSAQTENMISRILETKTAYLVQQDFESRPLEDLLAAVQALMLFHIIQIFDGDIRLRSIAEQNFFTLQSWTMQLKARAGDMGPALTWQEWIFAESIRRTVIFSMIIDSLYTALKYGYCTNVPALSMLPFTSGAALWDADTNSTWLIKMNGAIAYPLPYGEFSKAWENGQVHDELGSFEKLLLTPCMGEKCKELLEIGD